MDGSRFGRRHFLQLAGGTIAYAIRGTLVHAAELPPSFQGSLASRLSKKLPALDGALVFDEAVCHGVSTDFGNYIHHVPVGVLFPKSARDIEKIVQLASDENVKVVARGHACSAWGQALVQNGIVIATADLKGMQWVGENHLSVEPGTTWQDVLNKAAEKNLMPPVFPGSVLLTVGGVINAGGFGDTSCRKGAVVDHVTELRVVTPSGKLVSCSPRENPELFNAMLGGMGQCGIVVGATLKLEPAPANVLKREFQYADLPSLIHDLGRVARDPRANAVIGYLKPNENHTDWKYSLTTVNWLPEDNDSSEWLKKLTGKPGESKTCTFMGLATKNVKRDLDAREQGLLYVPNPFLTWHLPENHTEEMLKYITSTPETMVGSEAAIEIFPALRSNFKQGCFQLPQGELIYQLRIKRRAEVSGSPEHLKMIQANELLIPRILDRGGTMYPPHSPVLTPAQWRQQFGDSWSAFAQCKKTFDPRNLLTPGVGMFTA